MTEPDAGSPTPGLTDFVRRARATPPEGKQPPLPPEAEAAAAQESNHLGKYLRVALLGQGGMADVWKAWDTELGRWVALKFPRHESERYLERLVAEARTAAGLSHPNLAAVYDWGRAAGRHFIAMEFIDGSTLADAGDDVRERVRILRDAALGVAHAHARGLVHRDLKPANIMVARGSGRAVVMDFGLARPITDELRSTRAIGTPMYMAPEQVQGGRIDPRTDVWALGATLYGIVGDAPPFVGLSAMELMQLVLEEDPPVPRGDRELGLIAMKCLSKDPARRYADAASLAEDLTQWLEGGVVQAHGPSAGYRLRKWIGQRRSLTLAMLAGAALVAVAGMAALPFVVQWGREDARDVERRHAESLRSLAAMLTSAVDQEAAARRGRIDWKEARAQLEAAVAVSEAHEREWPGTPQGGHARARLLLALRRVRDAERAARDVVKRHPGFEPGWTLLGRILAADYQDRSGGPEGTQERYRRMLSPVIEEAVTCLERGRSGPDGEAGAANRWGLAWTVDDRVWGLLAEAYLLDHRRPNTSESTAHLQRAWAEVKDEMFALALGSRSTTVADRESWITRAIELAPGWPLAYVDRAVARLDSGRVEAALTDLDRAIALDDHDWRPRLNRGTARAQRADREGALEDLTRAIELAPDVPWPWFNRGLLRHRMGHIDAALEDLTRAVELDPDAWESYEGRAISLLTAERAQEALADLDKAIGLKPDRAPLFVNRAAARRMMGDFERALEDYSRAVDLDAKFARAWADRGLCRSQIGDKAGAIQDYTKALELDGGQADVLYRRGNAWRATGDMPRAEADFAASAELDPTKADTWFNLGASRMELARLQRGGVQLKTLEGARTAYRKAVELYPAGSPNHVDSGRVLEWLDKTLPP